MTDLKIDTDSVTSFARNVEALGASVVAQSGKGKFDTAAMVTVFGLIGADFMSVAAQVTDKHHNQVGELGKRLDAVGKAVAGAAKGFTDAEDANAASFGGQKSSGESSNLANGLDPTSQNLSKDQVAKIIIARGKKMGMSDDEIKSALATALVESNMQNINYGDRDSIGVFQQRGFDEWTKGGTRNRMSVDDSATSYYEHLKGTTGTPGDRAQQVQRSAFPDKYAERMNEATDYFNRLASSSATPSTTPTVVNTATTTSPDVPLRWNTVPEVVKKA